MFPRPLIPRLVVTDGSHIVLSVDRFCRSTVEQQHSDGQLSAAASLHKYGVTVLTTAAWMMSMRDRHNRSGMWECGTEASAEPATGH